MSTPELLAYVILCWYAVSAVWDLVRPYDIVVTVNNWFKGTIVVGIQVTLIVCAGLILGLSAAAWVGIVAFYVIMGLMKALVDKV